MKKSSFDTLLDVSVSARAFNFYYLNCGDLHASIATLAPISVGDIVHYDDEEAEQTTTNKFLVKSIHHTCDAASGDNRILMTILECDPA